MTYALTAGGKWYVEHGRWSDDQNSAMLFDTVRGAKVAWAHYENHVRQPGGKDWATRNGYPVSRPYEILEAKRVVELTGVVAFQSADISGL